VYEVVTGGPKEDYRPPDSGVLLLRHLELLTDKWDDDPDCLADMCRGVRL